MLRFCLCVLLGAFLLHQAEQLPPAPWIIMFAVLGGGLLLLQRLRLVAALLLGFVVSAASSSCVINSRLDARLEGKQAQFAAIIREFPAKSGDAVRLVVSPLDSPELPSRIRLSWYDAAEVPQLGEHWLMTARLRAPRGLANPNGFDYEAWLFRQKIGATGYVVAAERIEMQPDSGTVLRLRRRILARIHTLLPDDAARAVLTAVTIGARQNITRDQWDLYARTGTSHLMAISGLHVGLAAAGLFFLTRLIASPLANGRNVRDLAVIVAASGSAGYALISGLAVPAQRALLMVLLVCMTTLRRRQRRFDQVVSIACLALFTSDPLAVQTPGFQLSFLAVALLLWSARQCPVGHPYTGRLSENRVLLSLVRLWNLQVLLLLGLIPVIVLQFGRIAWLAPVVNLAALPVFNFVTVPLSLAGIVLDGLARPVGDALLQFAHSSVELVLWIVVAASNLPHAELQTPPIQGCMIAVLWMAAMWAILPPGFPGRYLAWVATLAIALHRPEMPPPNCADIHVLDVGQGLSTVIQTRTKLTVFDTGPAFRSGSDTALLVLVPFVRSLGRERIDTLIVSHSDLDHAGGVATLLQHFSVGEILTGERLALSADHVPRPEPCVAGQVWHSDGIDFRILHPSVTPAHSGNNASCVLEISAGGYRALLTGDIESAVERSLLGQGLLRRTQIVVVPHHGSLTSSSDGFISLLRPDFAIASTGFGNRWGFPRPEVVRRWQVAGAQVLTTAASGSVSHRLCKVTGVHPAVEQRKAYRRYWHARS